MYQTSLDFMTNDLTIYAVIIVFKKIGTAYMSQRRIYRVCKLDDGQVPQTQLKSE